MEKRVLNKLNYIHIVQIYSTFQDYGSLYYQMEYLEGGEVSVHIMYQLRSTMPLR